MTIEDVSYRIGEQRILREISAAIPSGALTGLLGPNGAGKSTLLRVVAGITTPDSGRVLVDHEEIHALDRKSAAQRVALLEQNTSPTTDLSAIDVALLGRIPHRSGILGDFRGDDDRRIALDALDAVGMAAFADRRWHTLSGGQQQRVQIARAIAQQPSVLLLDEPTNHLDVSAQLSLLSRVRRLGITTFAALHDLTLAGAYCDHLILLDGGELVAQGAPHTVLRPELISRVYGVDSVVVPHPKTGHPVVLFSPLSDDDPLR
ncbi:ABC transporter ATP-binding protein [Compostimonas suwonensis]|uniref:ABC transporter ATP-binding protein n=1 Tax=Compostimonas suwonensis TaxID=1048394 RepID=UPI001FE59D57|nr:ABC transporter ATP-binding protein [Compostimonas suwonensis]